VEVISPDPRGYAKVKQAARYTGVSERTFRDYLKTGLPHFRLSTGTILIAYRDIDEWFKQFRVDDSRIDSIVNELTEGLR
jgi:excisionase family DNA binding protein